MPDARPSKSLFGRLRMLWRDDILWITNISEGIDANLTSRFIKDTGYQYKWSRLDVHRTMMADDVRVRAFEKAINESVGDGDTVLDMGTGLGVLAFFAAKAGARRVYAIDSASVIKLAGKIAVKNKLDNIEFVRADIRDVNVPPVDCVIAELLGVEAIDEGFVEKVAIARKFLKPGGRIIPLHLDVYVAPAECKDVGVGFWDNLYGVDYTPVERDSRDIKSFEATWKTRRLAPDALAVSIDSKNPPEKQIKFEHTFTVEREGEFHGLMMHFKAHLSDSVVLDTSPEKPLTHWKQALLPEGGRATVKKGDKIKVKLWATEGNNKWKWEYSI